MCRRYFLRWRGLTPSYCSLCFVIFRHTQLDLISFICSTFLIPLQALPSLESPIGWCMEALQAAVAFSTACAALAEAPLPESGCPADAEACAAAWRAALAQLQACATAPHPLLQHLGLEALCTLVQSGEEAFAALQVDALSQAAATAARAAALGCAVDGAAGSEQSWSVAVAPLLQLTAALRAVLQVRDAQEQLLHGLECCK